MKILKIFGVVVGIHAFALILIFANPGCSSASKPAPSPSDTIAADASPSATVVPPPALDPSPVSAAPAPDSSSPVIRFSPTRPGTAAANTLETAPVADVTPATTYTVSRGDSLWSIARKNHLTVSELASANNLKPGAPVRLGQKLIIPGKAPAGTTPSTVETADTNTPAPAPTEPKVKRETVHHTVKPGETLGAIARKYQVKVGDIATANSIADPAKIRPGMDLVIPGWQAPAKSAARPAPAPAAAAPATPSPAPASASSPVQPAGDSVPTIVIPAPEQQPASQGDLDSGVKPSGNEPPVIQVDDTPKS